ncbi:hypothetical protein KKB43_03225 [Patescibacteria group bacterium]|nr:hypothetical protein [Patescibacteria group bacterium]MBU4580006.1 hypothetical protein [Patescibacteria group bacterium]
MDFNWENYLKLAKNLQKVSIKKDVQVEEACYRTAISRAYYAVYHLALEFAEIKFGYMKKIGVEAGKNHSILPKEFNEWFNKYGIVEYRRLAILLKRTRNYRTKSDYDDNIGKTEPLMDVAILDAEEAIDIISSKNQ